VRFGEIEGDKIDIRPEIKGDRTVQDSKITFTNKGESLQLQYSLLLLLLLSFLLSPLPFFLSISLSLPHITPNSLNIAATAPLLPPQPADKKKAKNKK